MPLTTEWANWWRRHRFVGLVALALVVAMALVAVGLTLYMRTGTYQLDLSRPGYDEYRNRAVEVQNQQRNKYRGKEFSASGPLTPQQAREFEALYSERLRDIDANNGFGNEVLGDEALGIAPPTQD